MMSPGLGFPDITCAGVPMGFQEPPSCKGTCSGEPQSLDSQFKQHLRDVPSHLRTNSGLTRRKLVTPCYIRAIISGTRWSVA